MYIFYVFYVFMCSFLERRKRQRAEDLMYRRREFQERFSGATSSSRYRTSRQSTDTGIYNLCVDEVITYIAQKRRESLIPYISNLN